MKYFKKNNVFFGSHNIRFICADGLNDNLPTADLLICKDVLQHLPNAYITALIPQFKKYRYCLITDNSDVILDGLLYTALYPLNQDIASIGLCRPIDLRQDPFNIIAQPVLTYISTVFVMQTMLIDNTAQ